MNMMPGSSYRVKHLPRGRREQTTVQKCHQNVKIVKVLEFRDDIWNHHQISTNMPGIGSLIHEIHVKLQNSRKQNRLLFSKTNVRVQSIKFGFSFGQPGPF